MGDEDFASGEVEVVVVPGSGVVVSGDEERFRAGGAADLAEVGEHFFGAGAEGIGALFEGITIEDDGIGAF